MESTEIRLAQENGASFIKFCREFECRSQEGTVLKIYDDFGFHHQGGKDKRWAFIHKAHQCGLRTDVELESGGSGIYINLPQAVEGIARVEYYLTKDN